MEFMFFGCKSLKELNPNNFNTDNVTNVWKMFNGCYYESINKIRNLYSDIKKRSFF